MCGRYTLTGDVDSYADYFGVGEVHTEALEPNYNVAPTDSVYAVATHNEVRQLGTFRWGLLPFWARDRRSMHINARVETVATKEAFRESFQRRRCLIPADGFYEWERLDNAKLPHYIFLKSRHPMGFAGIWSRWRDPSGGDRLTTCAILTREPDETVGRLHDRMPVILDSDRWSEWLDPDTRDTDALLDLVTAPSEHVLDEYAVSTLVNSVDNNLPELIEPLGRT